MKKTVSSAVAALLCASAILGVSLYGFGVARAQSQAEMTQQAGNDFKKADTEMNAAYDKLLKSLDKPTQAMLRDSQRAWLKFRDAEVDFRASKVKGGTIYPMIVAVYMTRLTQERTKELKEADKTFRTDGAL